MWLINLRISILWYSVVYEMSLWLLEKWTKDDLKVCLRWSKHCSAHFGEVKLGEKRVEAAEEVPLREVSTEVADEAEEEKEAKLQVEK